MSIVDCHAVQQSDEMCCAPCNLRWDINDSNPPECRKSLPTSPDQSREVLIELAGRYNELRSLEKEQNRTTALLIRTCVARLGSPDSRKRREAIDSLEKLAIMMERRS